MWSGAVLIVMGVAWFAFFGKHSFLLDQGRSRLFERFYFVAGISQWPPRYDFLAVALQSAVLVAVGISLILGELRG